MVVTHPQNPGMAILLAIVLGPFVTTGAARAAGDPEVPVEREGGRYSIHVETLLKAPADQVRAVLLDYRHIYRLSPSITESAVLASGGGGRARVRTVVESCVSAYCVKAARVEDVEEGGAGEIRAVIVPELSDFRFGVASWSIRAEGAATRVVYRAEVEPGFFVPPLLGTYFVKRNLRREVEGTLERLELIAGVNASDPGMVLAGVLGGSR